MSRPFRFAVQGGPFTARDAIAERPGSSPRLVDETPFALVGTEDDVVDKLLDLREDLGISRVVVRDARGFAPIVDTLPGT